MTETLVPLGFFVAIAFIIVAVTRIISDGRTRRRLIESGASPELARAIAVAPDSDMGMRASLQWGLVVGAIGIALIIIHFLPFDVDVPFSIGVLFVFTAGGLLAYYAAARRMARQGGAAPTV
jgi:hypothetical protein